MFSNIRNKNIGMNVKAVNLIHRCSLEETLLALTYKTTEETFENRHRYNEYSAKELMKTVCGFTEEKFLKQLGCNLNSVPKSLDTGILSKTYKFRTKRGSYKLRIRIIGDKKECIRFSFFNSGVEVTTTLLSMRTDTAEGILTILREQFLDFVFKKIGIVNILGVGSLKRFQPYLVEDVPAIYVEDYPGLKKHRPYFKGD